MTNATCICLGSCNCECDPNVLPVQDCISEEASDPGDRGVTSGGGTSLSWFEGVLDSLGLGLGIEFGSLLSILVLILVLFCLKKTGIFKVCCGKSKVNGTGKGGDDLGQSRRFVSDKHTYHHPPPPLPLLPVQLQQHRGYEYSESQQGVQLPTVSAPLSPPALPLLPPPVIPAPVSARSPPKLTRPTRAAPCRTSAAGGQALNVTVRRPPMEIPPPRVRSVVASTAPSGP